MPLDAGCFDPAQDGLAGEFGSVVGDDHRRSALQFANPVKFADDPDA